MLIYVYLMCNKLNECDKNDYVYEGITQYVELLLYGKVWRQCWNVTTDIEDWIEWRRWGKKWGLNACGMYLSCLLVRNSMMSWKWNWSS